MIFHANYAKILMPVSLALAAVFLAYRETCLTARSGNYKTLLYGTDR